MPTIVISGYYGAGNTGDEAILAAMLQALRRALGPAEIIVLSRDPARTTALHKVPALHRGLRRDLRGKWCLLRRADLLISGGGGLLQDVYPRRIIPASVLYYLSVCVLAKCLGCRVMLYAQGVGPLRTTLARLIARVVLNRLDLISVRDGDSADLLRKMGVRRPPVHVTADPVLAWQPADPDAAGVEGAGQGIAARGLAQVVPTRRTFAIVLRPWTGGDGHLRIVARVAERAAREWGLTPVFVPFMPVLDRAACESVRRLVAADIAPEILPELPPEEVYQAISQSTLVLGMRLHSLIFAALAGVPLVGLAYDPKVRSFLDLLGQADRCCPLNADPDTIWQALALARSAGEDEARLTADRLRALKDRALQSAELAGELLRARPKRT